MSRTVYLRMISVFVCVIALTAAYHQTQTEAAMVDTANRFLDSLNAKQKAETQFDFDVKDRVTWHYFPENGFAKEYGYERRGITFKTMDPKQVHLAHALLSTGLSRLGYVKASNVMSLEEVVRVIEDDNTGHRDAEKFHFTIFGKPSASGTWGWRVEGHHVSLHYVLKNGRLVSSTPTFFGANPHEVPQGPHEGMRALEKEEDLALKLVKSLDHQQTKKAIYSDVAPYDIVTMADQRAELEGDPKGLPASKMNDRQYEALMDLVAEYAHNMPPEIAAERMKAARGTPRDRLYFGWAGSLDRPKPPKVPIGSKTTGNRAEKGNYYRIHAPGFLVEYDNTQNKSNHSHSVWRDFDGDFGLDVLALHHRRYDHRRTVGSAVAAD